MVLYQMVENHFFFSNKLYEVDITTKMRYNDRYGKNVQRINKE